MIEIARNIFGYDPEKPLLFTELYFWLFLLVVLALLALTHRKIAMRNAMLCAVSYFFYYKSSGLFLLILAFTTVSCYYIGARIHKSEKESSKRAWLILGLITNLGTLCYFKYAYFITDMLNNLFGLRLKVWDAFAWLGNQVAGSNMFDVDNILLPVGISFFIFQSISYLMDIYRKKIEPLTNILDFGFFVSFFPQLVAGPIVRASTFIPQIYKPYFLGKRQFGLAIFWILNGLTKKIILSDYIAVNFIDRVFTNPDMYSGFETLIALFGYSLQVYADFSGYTDIATGVAMLMGFELPLNFNSPYKAPNPGNFWKRWHISLSRWLQDYLYIPLGGNREASFGTYCCIATIALIGTILSGSIWIAVIVLTLAAIIAAVAYFVPERRKKITTNINSMNTMLLGGLWHGASWNFMIWGGLNGIGMVVFKFWKNRDVYERGALLLALTVLLGFMHLRYGYAIFTLGLVWSGFLFLGTFIRMSYNLFGGTQKWEKTENVWAITQTFIFITFTRLFFRSGSNLDPALANQTAWQTAKTMINQLVNAWNVQLIPDMIIGYRYVFCLIVIGMVVHWLSVDIKRRYRLSFALMPLPLMAAVSAVIIFVVYQFATADLQSFIYFQF